MTRAFHDAVADSYVELFGTGMAGEPRERAVLGAFAQLVGDTGPVADVGCGPGRIAAYLHDLGLAGARDRPLAADGRATPAGGPGVRFEVGSMTALDLPDGALGGLVASYSCAYPRRRSRPSRRTATRPDGPLESCDKGADVAG